MPKSSVLLHALTVGEVSAEGLARVDLERTRLAAETQSNLLPKVIGSAIFRPGSEYIGATEANNKAVLRSFEIDTQNAAVLELTDSKMRVRVNGALVTRASVTSTVTSGDFSSATGWTLTASSGATAAVSGGELTLTADARGSSASCSQAVSTSSAGTEHALRIVVTRGTVTLRLGTTSGGDELISETGLREGEHSLAFTPSGGTYYIEFSTRSDIPVKVSSCTVESAGAMEITSPWAEADLYRIRGDQSADVLFLACAGYQQRRVERRSNSSWSVVKYYSETGPFVLAPSSDAKLTPSVTRGTGTLSASRGVFRSSHVGATFRLFHSGQRVIQSLADEDEYTDPIRVTGVESGASYNDRQWIVTITGTWSGTLRTQRSFDGPDSGFQIFRRASGTGATDITANGTYINADNDDNAIIYYRVGFDPGVYTSGEAQVTITYSGGGGYGICRVTAYNSPTSVDIEVLEDFKQTESTKDWRESEWSDVQGWPTCGSFYDGRLFWGGRDKIWGSYSNEYDNFDEDEEGDARPILRNIATGGGVNQAYWMLSLQRLIIGTDRAVISARSSSFDEPLTADAITLREIETLPCADLQAVRVGDNGLFIDGSLKRLMELVFEAGAVDYAADDLTKINRDILSPGVIDLAVQRRPDTRVWMVKSDGTCTVLTYDRVESIIAFTPVSFGGSGFVEAVTVTRGEGQDKVYVSVRRTINGNTVRYVECLADDDECIGGTLSKNMDSHLSGTNSPASATITGLDHLEGESVVVWADGKAYPGPYTVSGGSITLEEAVTDYVAGLSYIWQFKSAKLAYASGLGTAINQRKRVDSVGFLLVNTHNAGVQFGRDFDHLNSLPQKINGDDVSDTVHAAYDHDMNPFGGQWDTDSRVCLQGQSPYPATVSGITLGITTHDKG